MGVVEAVVRRGRLGDVDRVVEPAQEAIFAEVQYLITRMSWSVIGISDAKPAPSDTIFLMLAEFLGLETWFDEQERYGHIIPHRITDKI